MDITWPSNRNHIETYDERKILEEINLLLKMSKRVNSIQKRPYEGLYTNKMSNRK